jgi:hypothetical protein
MNNLIIKYSIPELVIVIAISFIVITQFLLYIMHKTNLRGSLIGGGQGSFVTALNAIFAIIIGFVTIGVWQSHSRINQIVDKETNNIWNLYRTTQALPQPVRDKCHEALKLYVEEVIEKEWPAMSKGNDNIQALKKLKAFNDLVVPYIPQNNGELNAHAETLRLLSEYRELRRDRVMSIKPLIANLLWFLLIFNSLMITLLLCLADIKSYRIHSFAFILFSSALSVIFSLLILYNYPFSGPQAISVEPFKKLLEVYFPLP